MQQFLDKEIIRKQMFENVWTNKLDDVFADVAAYYDRVNIIASLGLLNNWRNRFVSTIETSPNQKVLDVCAGTNVIGRALLSKESTLDVEAIVGKNLDTEEEENTIFIEPVNIEDNEIIIEDTDIHPN